MRIARLRRVARYLGFHKPLFLLGRWAGNEKWSHPEKHHPSDSVSFVRESPGFSLIPWAPARSGRMEVSTDREAGPKHQDLIPKRLFGDMRG